MNVVVVSSTPKRPKIPIIYVTSASPLPKIINSIHVVPITNDMLDLYTRFMQSKATSYGEVANTYNTGRNQQNRNQPTSLPPSQPSLPKELKPIGKSPSKYNLVKKLHVTPTKISLWHFL